MIIQQELIEPVKEMTEGEIIQMIDDSISNLENWSVEDKADGREIEVFPEWKKFIEKIVWKYRNERNWYVLHMLHGEREYLVFTYPPKKRFRI